MPTIRAPHELLAHARPWVVARLLDALYRTLAQSDWVTLTLLRKCYNFLRNQEGCRISTVDKPQLTQGFLEGANQHFDLLWSEGGLLRHILLRRYDAELNRPSAYAIGITVTT